MPHDLRGWGFRHPQGWDSRYFHSEHLTFAYTEIAAGADVHAHHHEHEEVFYVIDGDLEVLIGDEQSLVRAGEVVGAAQTPYRRTATNRCPR